MITPDKEVYKKPNVCLLGLGRIGQIHAQNIMASGSLRLAGVVDVDQDLARSLASKWMVPALDTELALLDPDIDGVVIATSTNTHAELIERAAKNGKTIFCEKPIDLNTKKARRAIDVANAHSVPVLIGFNRRFDPTFRYIKDEIDVGRIGSVESVQITSCDPYPPPEDYVLASGGLFRDMAIHDFDMARWLLGENPTTVFSMGSCLFDASIRRAGDIDTAKSLLQTKTGRLAVINNSRRAVHGYDQRIEVHGSKGSLVADNKRVGQARIISESGEQLQNPVPFFLERYADAYKQEIEHFAKVMAGEKPAITGEDGLFAQMLADAASISVSSGEATSVDLH